MEVNFSESLIKLQKLLLYSDVKVNLNSEKIINSNNNINNSFINSIVTTKTHLKQYSQGSTLSEVSLSLYIEGFGYLSFPCVQSQLNELVNRFGSKIYHIKKENDSIQSTGHQDIGLFYYNVWKIPPNLIRINSLSWLNIMDSIVTECNNRMCLGGGDIEKFDFVLDKLLICGEGSYSLPIELQDQRDHIYTLFIVLPSLHQGGEIVINSNGKSTSIAFDNIEPLSVKYLSVLNQIPLQAKPILNGNRVCLVYNILKTCKRSLEMNVDNFSKRTKIENNIYNSTHNNINKSYSINNLNDSSNYNNSNNNNIQLLVSEINQQLKDNNKLVYILNNSSYKSLNEFQLQDRTVLEKLLFIKEKCGLLLYLVTINIRVSKVNNIIKVDLFINYSIDQLLNSKACYYNIGSSKEIYINTTKELFPTKSIRPHDNQKILALFITTPINLVNSASFEKLPDLFFGLFETNFYNNIETDTQENVKLLEYYFKHKEYKATAQLNDRITQILNIFIRTRLNDLKRFAYVLLLNEKNCHNLYQFFRYFNQIYQYFSVDEIIITLKLSLSRLGTQLLKESSELLAQQQSLPQYKQQEQQCQKKVLNFQDEIFSNLNSLFKFITKEKFWSIICLNHQVLFQYLSFLKDHYPIDELLSVISSNAELFLKNIESTIEMFSPKDEATIKKIIFAIPYQTDPYVLYTMNQMKLTIGDMIKILKRCFKSNPNLVTKDHILDFIDSNNRFFLPNIRNNKANVTSNYENKSLKCSIEQVIDKFSPSSVLIDTWSYVFYNTTKYLANSSFCKWAQGKYLNKLLYEYNPKESSSGAETLIKFFTNNLSKNFFSTQNYHDFNLFAIEEFLLVLLNSYIKIYDRFEIIEMVFKDIKIKCNHNHYNYNKSKNSNNNNSSICDGGNNNKSNEECETCINFNKFLLDSKSTEWKWDSKSYNRIAIRDLEKLVSKKNSGLQFSRYNCQITKIYNNSKYIPTYDYSFFLEKKYKRF